MGKRGIWVSLLLFSFFPNSSRSQTEIPVPPMQIEAGKNKDGRLELFFLGQDRKIYHRWQLVPNGNWSPWHLLADNFSGNQIALAYGSDGELTLFYNDFNGFTAYQNGEYRSRGAGNHLPDGGIKNIVAGLSSSNVFHVFGIGVDAALYDLPQKSATTALTLNSRWVDDWIGLHKGELQQVAINHYANGELVLFGLGTDGSVSYTSQLRPTGGFGSKWVFINGSGLKQIVTGKESNGTLALVALGTDGATYYTWQLRPITEDVPIPAKDKISTDTPSKIAGLPNMTGTKPKGSPLPKATVNNWHDPWVSLDGGGLKQIVLANHANGDLAVFGLGTDASVYYTSQIRPNSGPTGPVNPKAIPAGYVPPGPAWTDPWVAMSGGGFTQLTATNYPNGALALFGLSKDGNVYQVWQTTPNGNWTTDWFSMGAPTMPAPVQPESLPKIASLHVDPNNGGVPYGTPASIQWQINNCGSSCAVTLRGGVGYNFSHPVLNISGLAANGSTIFLPTQTLTQFTLTAKNSAGTDSKSTIVTVLPTEQPSNCTTYFLKMTSNSSITPCFMMAVCAASEEDAIARAEAQNGGFSAEASTEADLLNGCN